MSTCHIPATSPELKAAALDAMPMAVLVVDWPSLTVLEANKHACVALRYSVTELIDRCIGDLCDEPRSLQSAMESAGRPHVSRISQRFRRKDGTTACFECRATVAECDGGEVLIIVFEKLSNSHRSSTLPGAGQRAECDPLTGLPNRRQFERRMTAALKRAATDRHYRFAVYFVDIDNFKKINDAAGHLAGDRVLCDVGHRLSGCVRPGDMVARFGGDEFTVLIDNVGNGEDAACVARRMLQKIGDVAVLSGGRVAASIGVAISGQIYRDPNAMLEDADLAMYHAKSQGGADFAFAHVVQRLVKPGSSI